ncbi:MAG: prolipoprotein diacylglyceryl transferase [Gemmatimonadota bacterium]|nr:MAG: prolipoprotein diacylglyceryl transferase [Gemmatimonadota bacterium]
MYPTLFRIGHFELATYGVVVALAVLAAGGLAARGFRDRGIAPDHAWTLLVYGLVGGFLGAKIYFALINGPQALLSRSGFVWYGGLIGGAAAVAWAIRRERLPLGLTADALAPALALGHGIGHIACFFSGDSYGIPSNLPWAVAFPRGAPPSTAGNLRRAFGVDVPASIPDDALLSVHPTMLYSAAALLAIAAFLWWYRRRSGVPGRLFAFYLILASAERFLVEFVRAKDDRLLWGATTAQAVAVALTIVGLIILLRSVQGHEGKLRPTPTPREKLAGP